MSEVMYEVILEVPDGMPAPLPRDLGEALRREMSQEPTWRGIVIEASYQSSTGMDRSSWRASVR